MTIYISEKDSDLWETPKELFKELDDEFHFRFDVCANGANALKPCMGDYFTVEYENCTCFMNPPYSAPLKFVKRAIELIKNNVITVCLLKSDTSTKLFHLLYPRFEVRFLKKRIKFRHPKKNNSTNANFASMVVIIK